MYTFDAQTAEEFVLVAEHKWTVFVINWHMECTAYLKCVSFPSMKVVSLCYLPHSFAVAVTHWLVFGWDLLGSISAGTQSSVVVWTSLVFSSIFRESKPFRPGQLASTAFTSNYSRVILPHRLSCWHQTNDKLHTLIFSACVMFWLSDCSIYEYFFFCFVSTCHGRWTYGCAYEIHFWSDIQMYTLRNENSCWGLGVPFCFLCVEPLSRRRIRTS